MATKYDLLLQHAIVLRSDLKQQLAVETSSDFPRCFAKHAMKLSGWIDYEDFGALILLECHERNTAGLTTSEDEMRRMLDRVRHRLVRRAKNTPSVGDLAEILPATTDSVRPEQVLAKFFHTLDLSSLVVFEDRFLHNRPTVEIASAIGVSVPTVYRMLADLKNRFMKFLDEQGS